MIDSCLCDDGKIVSQKRIFYNKKDEIKVAGIVSIILDLELYFILYFIVR